MPASSCFRIVRSAAGIAAIVAAGGCGNGRSPTDDSYDAEWSGQPITAPPGSSETFTIGIVRNGVNGGIAFSADQLPGGVTVAFSPNPATGDSSVGTVTVAGSVAPSTYHFVVHTTAAGATGHDVAITLIVANPASYTLSASAVVVALGAGSAADDTLNLVRQPGFVDDVFLSAIVPTGISVDFTPSDVTGTSAIATIHAAAGLAAGNYTVTIHGIVTGTADQLVTITAAVH